jgi:hypothetical protein
MKKPGSYVVNGALASAVLYFALSLSAAGRGPVDYAVIGLVCLAILWNIVQLGRRLHQGGGARAVWHLQRTLLFWIVGLLNTVFVRPDQAGGWRTWVGAALLVFAVADTIALFRKERRSLQIAAGTSGGTDS